MAIKAKGRTKARPAARAPRRDPVPLPVPWFRRRWVQVLAAFVAGLLAMMAVVWATNSLRTERASREDAELATERRSAVQTWAQTVESQIGTVGTFRQPPIPPEIQPALVAAIRELSADTPVPDAAATAKAARTATKAAADELEAFELADAIRDKGFDGQSALLQNLLNSQDKLVASFRAYSHAARALELALAAQGQAATDLLSLAKAEA